MSFIERVNGVRFSRMLSSWLEVKELLSEIESSEMSKEDMKLKESLLIVKEYLRLRVEENNT